VKSLAAGNLEVLATMLAAQGFVLSPRHTSRLLDEILDGPALRNIVDVRDRDGSSLNAPVAQALEALARKQRFRLFFASIHQVEDINLLVLSDRRGSRTWSPLKGKTPSGLADALLSIKEFIGTELTVVPHGEAHPLLAGAELPDGITLADYAHQALEFSPSAEKSETKTTHSHLNQLESESIRIIREAVAVAKKPGMLFSMGKDSMVMWALAKKAFWPEPPPFPLVAIDTRWKFREMYKFREHIANLPNTNLVVHINPDAITQNVNPFDFGSAKHTEITKTLALKQVLDEHRFDFVFGGARRDEERSRAKERVFSIRNEKHGWDPKTQRPELWNAYNTVLPKGQSMRVFPLSNWTELDVWRYIERENIPVVPLYFSKVRPFVERDGALIMVDDERFQLEDGETIHFEPIRFRTLGCYPLTGGVRSHAHSVGDIIEELEQSRVSERSSRVIDFDPGASMEQKKKDGYF
jgi:sulfate adenylyltransferase subunit 2